MKLLMISGDRSILERKQGAFWYTLQELRKHWDRIDVISPSVFDGQGRRRSGEMSLKEGSVFFHPCPKGLLAMPRWIETRGEYLIKEFGHDVMTVHEYPPFYNGYGAGRLARRTGIPYTIEIHHIIGSPKPANMFEHVGRMLSRFYLPIEARKAKAVRVVNVTVRDQLIRWGIPSESIFLVPSFYLDADIIRNAVAPPIIYDLAFSGRLVANKGLRELILVINKMPNVRLLVIGNGPEYEPSMKLVKRLKLDDRVTFIGWLPSQEAVISALLSASVFVMNSKSEGGPRTALEAMAAGMPVISTPVGVMPDVIEDGINGLLTNGTKKDLVHKIQMLIGDESLQKRLGEKAKKILDRFERKKLVRDYANFLKSLI